MEKTILPISIVIPLYNEQHSIKDILKRIDNNNNYEIIIVDDGSNDNSVKKVKEVCRKIKLIKHHKNQGYGASILTGLKYATGDIIITMDSDGQHNPEEIPTLIKPIIDNKADIVVGSRYLGKSKYNVPIHTRVGEFIINKILMFLFRQKIGNNQCGFRAFTKNSLKILKNMRSTKFGLCTETLFKAAYNKLRLVEVPISVNQRKYGSSNIKLIALFKSISFCILDYIMKKIGVNGIGLKRYSNDKMLSSQKNAKHLILNKSMSIIKAPQMAKSVMRTESINVNKSTLIAKTIAKTTPKVSVIFPSYNGERFLNRNLDSIKNLTNLHEIELIIIDNNSNDSSIKIIESYKNVININLIRKNSNLGFAKACNIGVENAKGEFIFITNQDVIFPTDFFQKLIPIYNIYNRMHEIIVSPAFIFEDNGSMSGINYFGAKIHMLGFSYSPELGQELPKEKIVKSTYRCSGGTLFMKKEIFLEIGGFEEIFFMYYEDTDLSLRALRQGLKIYSTSDPYLIHQKGDWTFNDFRYYLLERNRYISFFKNINGFNKLLPYFLLSEIILIFQSIITRKFRLRVRMYYELFIKRNLLRDLRTKSKKEAPLMPYQKLSRNLDPCLIGNVKNSKVFRTFLNLFNSVLNLI